MDRRSFDADPDPDPTFHFNADLDPDPNYILMPTQIRVRILPQVWKFHIGKSEQKISFLLFTAMPVYIFYISRQCHSRRCDNFQKFLHFNEISGKNYR